MADVMKELPPDTDATVDTDRYWEWCIARKATGLREGSFTGYDMLAVRGEGHIDATPSPELGDRQYVEAVGTCTTGIVRGTEVLVTGSVDGDDFNVVVRVEAPVEYCHFGVVMRDLGHIPVSV